MKINTSLNNLSSQKEPTDKQLDALMKRVTKNAVKNSKKAYRDYFKVIDNNVDIVFKSWESRIKNISNNADLLADEIKSGTKDIGIKRKVIVRRTKKNGCS